MLTYRLASTAGGRRSIIGGGMVGGGMVMRDAAASGARLLRHSNNVELGNVFRMNESHVLAAGRELAIARRQATHALAFCI
jgi:hypothetical protein